MLPGLVAAVTLAVRGAPEPGLVGRHCRRPAQAPSPQSPGPRSSASHEPSPRTVMRRCAVAYVGPTHGIDPVPIFCQRSDVCCTRARTAATRRSPTARRRRTSGIHCWSCPVARSAHRPRPRRNRRKRTSAHRHTPQRVVAEPERRRPVALACPHPAVHGVRGRAVPLVEPDSGRVGDPAVTGRALNARRQFVAPGGLVVKDVARSGDQDGIRHATVLHPRCCLGFRKLHSARSLHRASPAGGPWRYV
jgi:hypothetical protein